MGKIQEKPKKNSYMMEKKKSDELTEHLTFILSKAQRIKLETILKKNKISISKFVRELIFGKKSFSPDDFN